MFAIAPELTARPARRLARRSLQPAEAGDAYVLPPRKTSKLRPRVSSAVEEPILLIVARGIAVRLDGADLGERGLHRRPLVDRVEPALDVRVLVELHVLHFVIARPRERRDVGDGVFVAAEIGRLASRFSSTS